MINKYKKEIILILALIVLGQVAFAVYSKKYTVPKYENSIYATMGVKNETSDLKMLNEAAHYFGQTVIGWTKFPHFVGNMMKETGLPEESDLNAHMQERQNIVFMVSTPGPIGEKQLLGVKDFIQKQLNSYNQGNKTNFLLSNVDFEQVEIRHSYAMGALIAFALSLILGAAVLFARKELTK